MASENDTAAAAASAAPAKGSRKNDPNKVLDQIKSLDANDDERTTLSKKISWILRHGAQQKKVDVKITDEGWVKISDLVGVEILGSITEAQLMKTIVDSNGQKLRYEVKEDKKAKQAWVRAYTKDHRKTLENASGGQSGGGSAPQAAQPPTPSSAAAGYGFSGLGACGYPGGNAAAQQAAAAAMAARQDPGALAAMAMAQAQMSYASQFGMPPMMPPQYGGYGWPPMFPNWYGGMASAAAQSQMPQQQVGGGKRGGDAGNRFVGKIKSYNAEKGFGFIECPLTKRQYDRDVFVHKAQIGNFKVGDDVSFTVELSKQSWPQAKELQYASAGVNMGGQGGGKGGGKGKDSAGRRKKGDKSTGGAGGGKGKGKDKKKEDKEAKKEDGEAAPAASAEAASSADAGAAPAEAPAAAAAAPAEPAAEASAA